MSKQGKEEERLLGLSVVASLGRWVFLSLRTLRRYDPKTLGLYTLGPYDAIDSERGFLIDPVSQYR